MRTSYLFIALLLTSIPSSQAFAWGAEGHKAVCQIAYINLTEPAKAMVDQLMSYETESDYNTFSKACTWPDSREPIPDQHRSEHYINQPRNTPAITQDSCGSADVCLFTAIKRDSATLADSNALATDKLQALKFLSHWLGDIHQPLHVSYSDDRGGNEIRLTQSIGCSEKLHAVWDTCIPRFSMNQHGNAGDIDSYAAMLNNQITPEHRNEWIKASVTNWANGSYQIATSQSALYCYKINGVCQYSPTQVEYQQDQTERELTLSDDYNKQFEKDVETRLKQAGIRLAHLLNNTFK